MARAGTTFEVVPNGRPCQGLLGEPKLILERERDSGANNLVRLASICLIIQNILYCSH